MLSITLRIDIIVDSYFFVLKYYQLIFNVHKYYESYYVIYNTIVHNKGDNHYAKFSKH